MKITEINVWAFGLGFAFALMSCGVLIWTFLTAYFSPTKTTTVSINQIGEANLELVLIVFSIPFLVYFFRVCDSIIQKRFGRTEQSKEGKKTRVG